MNSTAMHAIVESIRRRAAQGDCPVEPAHSREILEEVIIDLANLVGALGKALEDEPSQQPTAQPQRSGPDVDPIPGMRILLARWSDGRPTGYPESESGVVGKDGDYHGVRPWDQWDAGCYDILSTPDAKEKP